MLSKTGKSKRQVKFGILYVIQHSNGINISTFSGVDLYFPLTILFNGFSDKQFLKLNDISSQLL